MQRPIQVRQRGLHAAEASLGSGFVVPESGGRERSPAALPVAVKDPCEQPDQGRQHSGMDVDPIAIDGAAGCWQDHDGVVPLAYQRAVAGVMHREPVRCGWIRDDDRLPAERNAAEQPQAHPVRRRQQDLGEHGRVGGREAHQRRGDVLQQARRAGFGGGLLPVARERG